MVFSSVPFLFYYLPLLLAIYYLVPARFRKTRNLVLLIASLIFYAWGEGKYTVVLLLSILINHFVASAICRSDKRSNLIIGISLNLLILGFYKYAGFITSLFGATDWNSPSLPLGISFFTFQAISYLIDVSRKEAPATKSIINTALYICSFPQLIAGPIVRYKEVALQIIERKESLDQFSLGVKIFVIGMAQKVLIANTVGETADQVFSSDASTLNAAEAWYGLCAYTIQIFFDFAGYSNMAIGLGHLLGFSFPRNFNTPYSSLSVTEFWRRWHMTLSNWFRDYLYIPLGGNRVSQWRAISNLWIVFVLCGFWHGAAWTFIFWGIWHGFFLSIERLGLANFLEKLWWPLRNLYLVLAISLGWVLFRADSMTHALQLYQALFGYSDASGSENLIIINARMIAFMIIAFFLSTQQIQKFSRSLIDDTALSSASVQQTRSSKIVVAQGITGVIILLSLLALSVSLIVGNAYNPFIYFRF